MGAPIASMTGFAEARGHAEGLAIIVQIKSVNGRGLDIRTRLANGLDAIEGQLRQRLAASLTRGAVSLSVMLERQGAAGELVINQQALDTIIAAMEDLSHRVEAAPPRLDGILALRGVLIEKESAPDDEAEATLHATILETLDAALTELQSVRRREGAQLLDVLRARLDEIDALTARSEAHPSRAREAILARLTAQIADLAGMNSALSEDRLHQEALLLATKADIREELDRLRAHVAAARALLEAGGPVGRKLDFLSQEFNREANTLCSKSNAVELTAIGLDLKAAIDQLREQVQNIE